jgi:hypothetical protein
MAKNKKTRRGKHSDPAKRSGGRAVRLLLRAFGEFLQVNRDAFLLSIVVLHLLFCLAFIAALLNVRGPRPSRVLGETTQANELATAKKEEPQDKRVYFAPVPTGLYLGFSVAVWAWLIAWRRRLAPRLVRVAAMLLVPGTILVVCGMVMVFQNRT